MNFLGALRLGNDFQMNKRKYFLKILGLAEKRYGKSTKRLAGDSWAHGWQTLITTILSAQSRDETTIPVAESLFREFRTLSALANASYAKVFRILKSINYNKTKTKNVIAAAKKLVNEFREKIPDNIGQLTQIPGVGRKTANLVLAEVYKKPGITVDTHVHRISNVLGFVNTNTPHQTELALMKIAPKECWSRINRLFVLWGKEVKGRDKKKFMKLLES
ncbi:endonuclease III [Candidatus Woesearchaeota archaeon]|nr:endonuclease III [Candidatus Woesearchaeota archaeon]